MDYEKKEQNLELGGEVSWNNVSPEHNLRDLGNKVISSQESLEDPANTLMHPDKELVQFLPTSPEPISQEGEINVPQFNPQVIREEDGKKQISRQAISAIDNAIHELEKSKNPCDFNDSIRGQKGLSATYLEGSFNRKLGS